MEKIYQIKPLTIYIPLFSYSNTCDCSAKIRDEFVQIITDTICDQLSKKIKYTWSKKKLYDIIQKIFTSEMQQVFFENKITLQIRTAFDSQNQILFDFVTDLFEYFQKDKHIPASFAIHYSHILNSPLHAHITDLFANYPKYYSKGHIDYTTSKGHYKKTGFFTAINDKVNSKDVKSCKHIVTNKVYFYLDNQSKLLKHFVIFLLAIHNWIDPNDKELKNIMTKYFMQNRPPFITAKSIVHNLVLINPIDTSKLIPEIDIIEGNNDDTEIIKKGRRIYDSEYSVLTNFINTISTFNK